MKSSLSLAALGLAAAQLGACMPALAGEGHDHGDAAPVAGGSALPRFAAISETFELVGVLDGNHVTLYLDRFADNTPVRGAHIELDVAGAKLKAEARGDDAYEVVLAEAPKPGVLPITITVNAGSEVDLLAGEFDLHEPSPAAQHPAGARSWKGVAGWMAGGLIAIAALGAGARRVLSAREGRAGGAA